MPPVSQSGAKRGTFVTLVLLVGLIWIVYAQTLRFEFVFDDHEYITGNPYVPAGLTWKNVGWALTATVFANWHPLTWLSWMIDAELFGVDPRGFHMTNVVLHTANVLLLFALLRNSTGSLWRSAAAAGLFAIHPLHVESVAWVSERKDLLSTLFGLLSIAAYVRWVRGKRWAWYGLTIVAFVGSLLSKPMLVTLPFLLLLWDYWPLERSDVPRKRLLAEKIPLFSLSGAMCAVTLWTQQQAGSTAMIDVPLLTRCLNAVLVYAVYLMKTVWPANLSVFYLHPGDDISRVAVAAAALLVACLTGASFAQRRQRPYLLVGWLWYLGALVPVIGIVQVGRQQMADRYTYVPLMGIYVAVCWLVPSVVTSDVWRRLFLPACTAAVLGALLLIARMQTGHWQSDLTLFEHAAAVTDNNALAHTQLGVVHVRLGRQQKALAHYREALQIDSNDEGAHYNLANLLAELGRQDEAARHYREAVRIDGNHAKAHTNLGLLLDAMQQYDEAIVHYRRATAIDPQLPQAHYNWGNTLFKLGRYAEAVEHYRLALDAAPNLWEARSNLGFALYRLGRFDEAEQQYQMVLRADPDFAAARRGLEMLRNGLDSGQHDDSPAP